MAKILLFGASGHLGREWQALLGGMENDNFVIVPYTSSQLDITNIEKVEHEIASQQPNVIINCAAYTKVDKAEEERALAEEVNDKAVKLLAG